MNWHEFENILSQRLPSADKCIITVLRRHYTRMEKQFRRSKCCNALLQHCIQRISNEPSRIYTILNELKTSLVRRASSSSGQYTNGVDLPNDHLSENTSIEINSDKVRTASSSPTILRLPELTSVSVDSKSESCPPFIDEVDSDISSDDVVIIDPDSLAVTSAASETGRSITAYQPDHSERETITTITQYDQPEIVLTATATLQPIDPTASNSGDVVEDQRKKNLILRLEQLLSRLNQAIRKLEEQELDLDCLNSAYSPYVQLDKLKRRYLLVWRRLCDARKVARVSGRILRSRFVFNDCRYDTINERIEELVNIRHEFPAYADIWAIVSAVNKEGNLQLSSFSVDSLARELFVSMGQKLKRRRQEDFRHDFGCHLTDYMTNQIDPMLHDLNLRRTLTENKRIGDTKMDQVFEKYSQLQQNSAPDQQNDDLKTNDVHQISSSSDSDSGTDTESSHSDSDCNRSCDLTSTTADGEKPELTSLDHVAPPSHEVLLLSSDSESEHSSPIAVCKTTPAVSEIPVIELLDDDDDDTIQSPQIPPPSQSLPFSTPNSVFMQPSCPMFQRHQTRSFMTTMTRQIQNGHHMMSTIQTTNVIYHTTTEFPVNPTAPFLTQQPFRGRLVPSPTTRSPSSRTSMSDQHYSPPDVHRSPCPSSPDMELIVLD